MTTPQFLSLELISLGTQSHTLLPPNLSLWMSQDTSHSTCPVPPLKPLSPQHTLILPHLSHLSQWLHHPTIQLWRSNLPINLEFFLSSSAKFTGATSKKALKSSHFSLPSLSLTYLYFRIVLIYLFTQSFLWLQQVLAVALGIFSCSLWESSYLTRDQTEAPCFGSVSS